MSAPFGMSTPVFWIYVCALVVLVAGLLKIIPESARESGVEKILPFGRLFYAMPLAVFASEHFTLTEQIAGLVPRWIPAHHFWVYAIGVGFFCAALSITLLIQARLAAALVGITFFIFVVTMDLPGAVANPTNRFAWALVLRELAFSGGALALAMSATLAKSARVWHPLPRWFIAVAALFYGVEGLLHPKYVPVIPLNKLGPEWIPGRTIVTCVVGVVLIVGGAALLVNRKTRRAATCVGLAILLAILWVYLPMLVAAPKDIVALNFFFDTLLFCGAMLLLANSA